jgi:hypothetical protein
MAYDVFLRIRVTPNMKARIDALVEKQREELQDPSWQISAFVRDLLAEKVHPGHQSLVTLSGNGKCNT